MSASHPGILHEYTERLVAFELVGKSNITLTSNVNRSLLLFVGGLGDGLLTVPYVQELVNPLDEIGWSIVQVQTQSSYIGWGTGSLKRDDEDLHKAVDYFLHIGGADFSTRKIVLMGHSTGSQNVLYYLTQSILPNYLIAGIAQAPVSDREAAYQFNGKEKTKELVDWVKAEYLDKGLGNDVLPRSKVENFFGEVPTSANRCIDLTDVRGNDDFFSSDLDADDFAKTFGNLKEISGSTAHSQLILLMSERDEFVSPSTDKAQLLNRFRESIRPTTSNSSLSGIIPGATHNVGPKSSPEALKWLINQLITALRSFIDQ